MKKRDAVQVRGATLSFPKAKGVKGVLVSILMLPYFQKLWPVRAILRKFNPEIKTVLENLDLTIEEGETVGVFALNGGGKSTLLRLISGEYPADAGSVEVLGHPATSASNKGSVYRVGPSHELFSEFDAVTNAQATALWYGLDTEEVNRQMMKLLDELSVSLEDRAALADDLSTGTAMKVALARAILILENAVPKGAKILLVDEPSANLDPIAIQMFLTALEQMKRKNPALTIIIATNDAEDLLFCDRLISIENRQTKEHPERLKRIKEGLRAYKQDVLDGEVKPIYGERKASKEVTEQQEVVQKKGYRGNPVWWRGKRDIKRNWALTIFLVITYALPNLMALFKGGVSWGLVILTSLGVYFATINRAALRIIEFERGYFKNLQSLFFSPFSRLKHVGLHVSSTLRFNVIYAVAVFAILSVVYCRELSATFSLNMDMEALLVVILCFPGSVAFAYGLGLIVSPWPMLMKDENAFFLSNIIPYLTTLVAGFYFPREHLPIVLAQLAWCNPLTYLAQSLSNMSKEADWSLVWTSTWMGMGWLVLGYLAHCVGLKVAYIAKRIKEPKF